MRLLLKAFFVVSLTLPLLAQAPQIPVTGTLGSGGAFPLIVSPAVVFTADANKTMAYPEMSGSSGVLKVTSAVALTATRNLVGPLTRGFVWTVDNATTGGQSIQVIGASGTGVTIPNGQAAAVFTDGTNYLFAALPSGGSGLPTASAPGQIITATAAGTTYAVQGQIFYSQPGDTIASIETECSSLCTYVVTVPQTFTLGANHTLASNVQVDFKAGGLWTVNGAFTLTVGQVTGTLSQHFAGSSTIAGMSGGVPVEWFGATGYSTKAAASSGSDYTTQIQKALNALTGGGYAILQPLYYNVTAGLVITTSSVGIWGTLPRDSYNSGLADAHASSLISTAATGTILNIHGTSGTFIVWNTFKNFALERTVQPTGNTATGSIGLSLQYAGGVLLDTLTSNDSLDGFYFNGAPGYNLGRYQFLTCNNGLTTVNSYTSSQNINCLDVDSSNGVAMNSGEFLQVGGGTYGTAQTATSTAVYIHGTQVNDVDFDHPNSAGMSYGVRIVYTGMGHLDSDSDLHVNFPTLDNCFISCVYVSGFPSAGGPSINITNGYLESNTPSVKIVDIESSAGVAVTNNQIFDIEGFAGNTGIYANNSSFLSLNDNHLQDLVTGVGISLVGTTGSTIVGNGCLGPISAYTITACTSLTSTSTGNTVVGNAASGYVTTAYAYDGTSLANDVSGNSCSGSNIGTCTSGVPTGTAASFLATGSQVNGSPICTTATGCGGSYPLYNASGTLQTSAHTVIGTATVGTSNVTVTLSGSAVFTSASSYACTYSPESESSTNGFVPITYTSGSAFVINGDTLSGFDGTVRYICTGN
jgi:hypothetical protein